MPVINRLPLGGTGIKGSKLFPWMVDGIVDSSETFGGLGVNAEVNGRSNIATMASDGYLRIYNTSSGNGRVIVTTANMITQYAYDYVLMHITSLTTANNNQPLTWGGKNTKSATAPTVGIYTLGTGYTSLTDKWIAIPLVMVASGNYFAFGGTVDCRIDKIYFVKVKS